MPASACSTLPRGAARHRSRCVAALRVDRAERRHVPATPRGGAELPSRRARSTRSPRCARPRPEARLLAGSTDIGLWVNKQFRELRDLIYVGEVDELKRIERARRRARRSAPRASLEDAWRALAARWPTLTDMWLRFASPPIRNAGTMGGNVANGSPIGDSAPVLMALDAQLVLRQRRRACAACRSTDFYVDYMKNRLEPGEFVQAIEVPLRRRCSRRCAPTRSASASTATSRRVCAGFAIELDGDTVRDGAAAPSAAWRRSSSAPRRPRRRSSASRGTRRRVRRRAGRAGARLHAAHRHARQRRLPAAGGAEPAAALLARNAHRRRRCAPTPTSVWARRA